MKTRDVAMFALLPLTALAGGVFSGDSGLFNLDTGGHPGGARWVSAAASFLLDTWTPCCNRTSSSESGLFTFQPLPAQRFLAGDVRDADTMLPLADTQVQVAPGDNSQVSGPNGFFRLAPVAEGHYYQLSASHAGYLPATISNITVPEHQPAWWRILLEPIRPPAVTGLQISPDGVNVHLNWNPVAGATGYRVRAAWDQGGYWSPQATTMQTEWSTQYLQDVGQIRFYRVSAVW